MIVVWIAFLGTFVGLVLFWLACAIVMVVVHELGHAVAALLLGFRVQALRLGSGRPLIDCQVFGCQIMVGRFVFAGGETIVSTKYRDGYRFRCCMVLLAGTLGQIVLVVGTWSFDGSGILFDHFFALAVVATGVGFVVHLFPFKLIGINIDNDGIQLLETLRLSGGEISQLGDGPG